jgi:hypothetical protein
MPSPEAKRALVGTSRCDVRTRQRGVPTGFSGKWPLKILILRNKTIAETRGVEHETEGENQAYSSPIKPSKGGFFIFQLVNVSIPLIKLILQDVSNNCI